VPCRVISGAYLVDLVEKDDARLLDALQGLVLHLRAVDQLLLLLADQDLACFRDRHPLACLATHQSTEHVLEVDAHRLHALGREHLDGGHSAFRHLQLDLLVFHLTIAERPLERPSPLLEGAVRDRTRPQHEKIEQPVLRRPLGANRHLGGSLRPHELDAGFYEVTDDRLHITPDVPHLGELGRLDLEERRTGEPGEPTRDLGLADAGGPDHDDVLRRDLFAQLRNQLLAAPAISEGDSDCALGGILADNETVELADDLTRGQRVQIHACSSSTVMRSLV
jgi:hypothetical protein